MKIVLSPQFPPIPVRKFDWAAYDDETYDIGQPTGLGATKEAAVADLLTQLDEQRDNFLHDLLAAAYSTLLVSVREPLVGARICEKGWAA